MKKRVIEETLKKIRSEKIEPTPKWHFRLRDFSLWLGFSILVFLGSLSLGLLIFFSLDINQEFSGLGGERNLVFFWRAFPHLWLLLFPVLFFLAFFAFRHTRHGYQYDKLFILSGILLTVTALGTIIHLSHSGEKAHDCFAESLPYYKKMSYDRESFWSQPELGLLGGKIIEISENDLNLEDALGEIWLVKIEDGILVRRRVELAPEKMIRIIGRPEGEKTFIAEEIRAWEKRKETPGKKGCGCFNPF